MIRQRKLFVSFLLTLLLIISQNAWAKPGEPVFKKLENGLTVIIEEEHTAPVVSVQMWVRVGSADETDKEAGISHVFEHMLFKGTARKKVGEIAQIIESVGGDINAYTSFDKTVYHLTVPSRHFSTGLDIISDAIQRSSFDPAELEKELQVVLEEIRMNEDSPGRKLYKTLLSEAYTRHPYGRPVIGYVNTVESFTREQILGFFNRWYIPNNMTLVIAGDVDAEAALEAVKKEFKGFRKKTDPHKKRPVEPRQKEIRTGVLGQKVQAAHLGLAFHIPKIKDEDTYSLDVLSLILGGGESSRLYRKLKIDASLVHGISSYTMSMKDPGLMLITANLEAKNAASVVSGAVREIRRLEYEGPDLEELERAKFNLESDFIYSRETMDGIASKLGYFDTTLGDINYEKKYLEGIRKVSSGDIKRVAGKYLLTSALSAAVILPEEEKTLVTGPVLVGAAEEADKEARAVFAGKKTDAGVVKVRLDNGITLIVKEAHANPTVAFYATFPGGLRFEDARTNGAGNFTAAMLTMGTGKHSREGLARETEEMAASIGGFSGWNSTGVSGKFLSRFFDKGLDLTAEVIMTPTFPDEEIERLRKDTLAGIKRLEDNLPAYTFKLLYRSLYEKHPYGMPSSGSVETVSALKRDDLVKHYSEFFVPSRMVLVIVGDINSDYAIEKVKAAFKDFKGDSVPLPSPPAEVRQTGIRETGGVKEKEQTHIGIGFLGTTIGDADSYALKVMTEVLSGQGGRLFVNLRDKKSLAYSVAAFSKDGADPGMVGAYIGCAPSKKDEAIAGIFKELEEISTVAVTDSELKRAKMSLIGGYEIGLQEVGSQAADMANNELYGLGYDFHKVYPGKIEAVTKDDILRVAKKYLTLDAYTISVVGPNGATGQQGK